ncbi:hypothetical protein Tco_0172919 [Tanacetum coccineum]
MRALTKRPRRKQAQYAVPKKSNTSYQRSSICHAQEVQYTEPEELNTLYPGSQIRHIQTSSRKFKNILFLEPTPSHPIRHIEFQYANGGNQNRLSVVSGIANQHGNGNVVVARAKVKPWKRDAFYLQTQLQIAQKEEARIQLNYEEFDFMAAAGAYDEIEEVNANCTSKDNLQQASTSGTQTDSAPVYDLDGSAVNDTNVNSEVSSVEQSGGTVEQHPVTVEETHAYFESLYINLAIKVEKVNTVNHKLRETNTDLTTEVARYKNQEKCFEISQEKYDKLERCYQKSVYQEQCLTKKINALHLSSDKHDPPAVYDSEETLQLAQEGRLKMKQLNKEIKPVNYTKINHLSGVFVSQTAKSREELYFSNTSKTANVTKSISIPNDEFSDDTTPSVAQKFLNDVKSNIVTHQCVVKQKMTLDIHNWSSSARQEIHKIIKDEILPIVNQVDARVENFEIQFLKEAVKFVQDFKSLAKEADESLTKHKALELEIERLLRAVVSQDIMSIVQSNSVVDTSNLQTELERTKERFENYIIKKENEYAKLWNDWYKKCEECKYDKILYDKAYNDMQQKIERLQAQLGDQKGKSKDTSCVSEQKGTTHGTSANTKFAKQSILGKPPSSRPKLYCVTPLPKSKVFPKVGESNALSKPVTSNSAPSSRESTVMNNERMIAPGIYRINPFKASRVFETPKAEFMYLSASYLLTKYRKSKKRIKKRRINEVLCTYEESLVKNKLGKQFNDKRVNHTSFQGLRYSLNEVLLMYNDHDQARLKREAKTQNQEKYILGRMASCEAEACATLQEGLPPGEGPVPPDWSFMCSPSCINSPFYGANRVKSDQVSS